MKRMIATVLVSASIALVGSTGAQANIEQTDQTNQALAECYPEQPQLVGTAICSGVRPGAAIYSFRADIRTGACTLNFMFRGSDGHRYMGTAGHCLLEDGREDQYTEVTYEPGKGPKVFDAENNLIGRYAYAILEEHKGTFEAGDNDFALVRLDSGVAASPRMSYFGGPTGINNDSPTEPTLLHLFGRGLLVGDTQAGNQTTIAARTGVAFGMPDADKVFPVMAANLGDSGGPVISEDGRAVGLLATASLNSDPGQTGTDGVHTGTSGVTRLLPQLKQAERVLGINLRLVTAKFTPVR